MITKLLYILGLLILIGTASAWEINDQSGQGYTGNVTFNADGTGVATINNYPPIDFTYTIDADQNINCSYMFYKISLDYNATGNYIYSPQISGITLIQGGN